MFTKPVAPGGTWKRRFRKHLALPIPHPGKIYYVSALGSDSNNGLSPSAPWLTVNQVNNSTFYPGDTILFRGGDTFSDSILYFHQSGTAAQPIMFGSYGTGQAILTNEVNIYDQCGLIFQNLSVQGSGAGISTSIGIVAYNDLAGYQLPITVMNCTITGWANGVVIGSSNGGSYNGITISNCDTSSNRDGGITIYAGNQNNQNVVITGCTANNNTGDVANTGSATGIGIYVSNTDGGVISNCTASGNGIDNACTFTGPAGIVVCYSNSITIKNCVTYNNQTGTAYDGDGIYLNNDVTNSVVEYCISYQNGGSGIICGSGDAFWTGNTIRYNITWGNSRNSTTGAELLMYGPLANLNIYGNTFIGQDNGGTAPSVLAFLSATFSNVNLWNNIFYCGGNGYIIYSDWVYTGITFQGNDYWSANAFNINWGVPLYTSLTAWRTATGQEILSSVNTGMQSDPLLLSPSAVPAVTSPSNLAPAAGTQVYSNSPMIGAGLPLASDFSVNPGTQDFFGNPLSTPLWIGAFQGTPQATVARPPASPGRTWKRRFTRRQVPVYSQIATATTVNITGAVANITLASQGADTPVALTGTVSNITTAAQFSGQTVTVSQTEAVSNITLAAQSGTVTLILAGADSNDSVAASSTVFTVTLTGTTANVTAVAVNGIVNSGSTYPAVPVAPGRTWRRLFRSRSLEHYSTPAPVNVAGVVSNTAVASSGILTVSQIGLPASITIATIAGFITISQSEAPSSITVMANPEGLGAVGSISNVSVTAVTGNINILQTAATSGDSVAAPSGSPLVLVTGQMSGVTASSVAGTILASLAGSNSNITVASSGVVSIGPAESNSNSSVAASSGSLTTSLSGLVSSITTASSGAVSVSQSASVTNITTASSGIVSIGPAESNSNVSVVASSGSVALGPAENNSNIAVTAVTGSSLSQIPGAMANITTASTGVISTALSGATANIATAPPAGTITRNLTAASSNVPVTAVSGTSNVVFTGPVPDITASSVAGTVLISPAEVNSDITVTGQTGSARPSGSPADVSGIVSDIPVTVPAGSIIQSVLGISASTGVSASLSGQHITIGQSITYCAISDTAADGTAQISPASFVSAISSTSAAGIASVSPAGTAANITTASRSYAQIIVPGSTVNIASAAFSQSVTLVSAGTTDSISVASPAGSIATALSRVTSQVNTSAPSGNASPAPAGNTANIDAVSQGSTLTSTQGTVALIAAHSAAGTIVAGPANAQSSILVAAIAGTTQINPLIAGQPGTVQAASSGSTTLAVAGTVSHITVTSSGIVSVGPALTNSNNSISAIISSSAIAVVGIVSAVPVNASAGLVSFSTMPLNGIATSVIVAASAGAVHSTISARANYLVTAPAGDAGIVTVTGSLDRAEWGGHIIEPRWRGNLPDPHWRGRISTSHDD